MRLALATRFAIFARSLDVRRWRLSKCSEACTNAHFSETKAENV